MFTKDKFGIVFNTLFSLMFASVMTLFALYMNHGLSLASFITGLVPAFAINFTLGSYIPLVKVGDKFASLFVKNPESKIFIALRILAIVVIMTAAMSFLVMFSQMGFTKAFLIAFAKSLLPSLAFAYVVALICFPFLLKLTIKLCSKEE